MIFVPMLHYLQNKNSFSGNEDGMRYLITPGKRPVPDPDGGEEELKLAAAEARDNAAKLSPRDAAAALRAKADEAMEAARKSSQEARLNASEAATAVKLAAKGTAERTAELLRLEQLAEELQARSEEMRARTRSSKYFGKGRMLRAYPKLRHGEKHRSLDELRERLKYERRH